LEVRLPYIPKNERAFYDKTIEEMCEVLHGPDNDVHPGHLNYIITRICLDIFKKNTCYTTLALITGVLENVKQELYRRQFKDYEKKKIQEHGDL